MMEDPFPAQGAVTRDDYSHHGFNVVDGF